MSYVCYTMIEQRARLLQDVIDKRRKIWDLVEILWVSRQTISTWKAKYISQGIDWLIPETPWPKKWSSAVNRTSESVEDIVCELWRKHWELWPVWLLWILEEEHDIILDQSTIWRILKRRWIRYDRFYRKLKKKKQLYIKDIPGREIQLDVSFPWWYQRKTCIYSAIDDCSRFTFSSVHSTKEMVSSIEFLKKLIISAPFKIQAIRTDQWTEFAQVFTDTLEEFGIEHIKNPPYTPQHNGKIERFHRTYKEQAKIRWDYKWSNEELEYNLQLYLYHYNYKKKHTGLGMNGRTPAQVLQSFWLLK